MVGRSTLKASEEVIGILQTAAAFDNEGITLGSALSRAEYLAVNKFLEVAGAKWNKKAKRHLFEPGAKEKLEALLDTGEIRDDKKHFQAFYTPESVAKNLVRLAGVRPGVVCLEPSAGQGAIADAIREAGGSLKCVELDPVAIGVLRGKGHDVLGYDFLDVDPAGAEPFDRVVMNPPFTSDQDIKHVLHAFEFLRPGGTLIAIMSPGFTFGETAVRRLFREFVEKHGSIVCELPAGTFSESGTEVRTVVVELMKEAK
jgi:predicted RNA methylase